MRRRVGPKRGRRSARGRPRLPRWRRSGWRETRHGGGRSRFVERRRRASRGSSGSWRGRPPRPQGRRRRRRGPRRRRRRGRPQGRRSKRQSARKPRRRQGQRSKAGPGLQSGKAGPSLHWRVSSRGKTRRVSLQVSYCTVYCTVCTVYGSGTVRLCEGEGPDWRGPSEFASCTPTLLRRAETAASERPTLLHCVS